MSDRRYSQFNVRPRITSSTNIHRNNACGLNGPSGYGDRQLTPITAQLQQSWHNNTSPYHQPRMPRSSLPTVGLTNMFMAPDPPAPIGPSNTPVIGWPGLSQNIAYNFGSTTVAPAPLHSIQDNTVDITPDIIQPQQFNEAAEHVRQNSVFNITPDITEPRHISHDMFNIIPDLPTSRNSIINIAPDSPSNSLLPPGHVFEIRPIDDLCTDITAADMPFYPSNNNTNTVASLVYVDVADDVQVQHSAEPLKPAKKKTPIRRRKGRTHYTNTKKSKKAKVAMVPAVVISDSESTDSSGEEQIENENEATSDVEDAVDASDTEAVHQTGSDSEVVADNNDDDEAAEVDFEITEAVSDEDASDDEVANNPEVTCGAEQTGTENEPAANAITCSQTPGASDVLIAPDEDIDDSPAPAAAEEYDVQNTSSNCGNQDESVVEKEIVTKPVGNAGKETDIEEIQKTCDDGPMLFDMECEEDQSVDATHAFRVLHPSTVSDAASGKTTDQTVAARRGESQVHSIKIAAGSKKARETNQTTHRTSESAKAKPTTGQVNERTASNLKKSLLSVSSNSGSNVDHSDNDVVFIAETPPSSKNSKSNDATNDPKTSLNRSKDVVSPTVTASKLSVSYAKLAKLPLKNCVNTRLALQLQTLFFRLDDNSAALHRLLGWQKLTDNNDSRTTIVFQCLFCPYVDTSARRIAAHIQQRHADVTFTVFKNTSYRTHSLYLFCRHCDFVTFDSTVLWIHFAIFHKVSGILRPPLVMSTPVDTDELSVNPDTTATTFPYYCCTDCQKIFVARVHAIHHLQKCKPNSPFSHCFVRLLMIGRTTRHHSETYKTLATDIKFVASRKDIYACVCCNYFSFYPFFALAHHIHLHRSVTMLFVCAVHPACSRRFLVAEEALYHLQTFHSAIAKTSHLQCTVSLADKDSLGMLVEAQVEQGKLTQEDVPTDLKQKPVISASAPPDAIIEIADADDTVDDEDDIILLDDKSATDKPSQSPTDSAQANTRLFSDAVSVSNKLSDQSLASASATACTAAEIGNLGDETMSSLSTDTHGTSAASGIASTLTSTEAVNSQADVDDINKTPRESAAESQSSGNNISKSPNARDTALLADILSTHADNQPSRTVANESKTVTTEILTDQLPTSSLPSLTNIDEEDMFSDVEPNDSDQDLPCISQILHSSKPSSLTDSLDVADLDHILDQLSDETTTSLNVQTDMPSLTLPVPDKLVDLVVTPRARTLAQFRLQTKNFLPATSTQSSYVPSTR